MTKDEALKLALEALERYQIKRQDFDTFVDVITAIKEALAQDELCSSQEPWMYRIWNDKDAQWRLTDDCSWPAEPIYTTPPKRPWVGLTDEERNYCVDTPFVSQQWVNIEAKLKEKNT